MEAPAWLAPKLQPSERVRWTHEPDGSHLAPALVSVGVAAYLAFGASGYKGADWWAYLPVWDRVSVPPAVAGVVGVVGFLANAAQLVVKHFFTGYAATDQRFLRVGMLSFLPSDAWPLAHVRIVESEKRRRGRARVRIVVQAPGARRRVARFRVRVRDADALRAALASEPQGLAAAATGSSGAP